MVTGKVETCNKTHSTGHAAGHNSIDDGLRTDDFVAVKHSQSTAQSPSADNHIMHKQRPHPLTMRLPVHTKSRLTTVALLLCDCLAATIAVPQGDNRGLSRPLIFGSGYIYPAWKGLNGEAATAVKWEDASLNAIVGMGGTLTGASFNWCDIERVRGTYNWTSVDWIVNATAAKGLAMLACVTARTLTSLRLCAQEDVDSRETTRSRPLAKLPAQPLTTTVH
jgi:hypothetical protein